jgi:hypothetical protein
LNTRKNRGLETSGIALRVEKHVKTKQCAVNRIEKKCGTKRGCLLSEGSTGNWTSLILLYGNKISFCGLRDRFLVPPGNRKVLLDTAGQAAPTEGGHG